MISPGLAMLIRPFLRGYMCEIEHYNLNQPLGTTSLDSTVIKCYDIATRLKRLFKSTSYSISSYSVDLAADRGIFI